MRRHRLHRGRLPQLARLVRFYEAAQDGTGILEMGLGDVARVIGHHCGMQSRAGETADALVCLYLEGPTSEAEVVEKDADGNLLLTDFTRAAARAWRLRRGRRFGCYKPRKNAGQRRTGWRLAGSDRAIQAGQRAATATLVAQASRGGGAKTIFGDAREAYARDPSARARPAEFANFRARTRLVRRKKRDEARGKKRAMADGTATEQNQHIRAHTSVKESCPLWE